MKACDVPVGEAFTWTGGVYLVIDYPNSHKKLVSKEYDDDTVVVLVLVQGCHGCTKPNRLTKFSRYEEVEPYENP